MAGFGLLSFRPVPGAHDATSPVISSSETLAWTAPEILRGGSFQKRSDVYSFGVVLWEIVTGGVPWAGMSNCEIVHSVGNMGLGLEVPQSSSVGCPTRLRGLLMNSLGSLESRNGFEYVVDALEGMLTRLIKDGDIPLCFVCPITLLVMEDPVICSDGHTYERAAIEHWLLNSNRSPKTNAELPIRDLTTNFALRDAITYCRR